MAFAPSEPFPEPSIGVAQNLTREGFPHGFATRIGGVSEGAFASLNFGAGDEPSRVVENVRRFAKAARFEPSALRQVTQVHGPRVVSARTLDDASSRVEADALFLRDEKDALTTSLGARAVGVRVADCVPILIGAANGVAAIHAGWRGVVAGVIPAALEQLDLRGACAAIGPCIGACCFEVGLDVASRIADAADDERVIAQRHGDKALVDLRRAVRAQLVRLGVTDIEDVPGCTRCDATRFFSYRRDGAQSGRHLAVIALRG